jgi:hypothetical protein
MKDQHGQQITVRPATAADAAAIGAVFDAAVRVGWTYLGDLVQRPMFTSEFWDQLVADHQSPDVLLVADHETDGVTGCTAAHPDDGESATKLRSPSTSQTDIAPTRQTEHQTSTAPGSA